MELRFIDSVPPWYSPAVPKPIYKSPPEALAFWDVPVYAEHTIVKANRVDARFVKHKTKQVWAAEMSCPWIQHREKKSDEKTAKYGPLRLGVKKQCPGYDAEQCTIIIDELGGWSGDLDLTMRKLFGSRDYCTELVGYTLTHRFTTHLYSTNPCFILFQCYNASYFL